MNFYPLIFPASFLYYIYGYYNLNTKSFPGGIAATPANKQFEGVGELDKKSIKSANKPPREIKMDSRTTEITKLISIAT